MAVVVVKYLGCIENIFTFDGQTGHDIDFIHVVGPIDDRLCSNDYFRVTEGDSVGIAKWVPIEAFRSGVLVLYPDGLVNLLLAVSGPAATP